MNIFYLRRAHIGTEPCGIYMASKLWQRTAAGKWRCGVERSTWEQHFQEVPYHAMARVGCGANYKPWGRGHGCVMEFRVADGAWYSMLCSLPPPLLQDSFERLRASWRTAAEQLSPASLFRAIPIVHPKCHVLPDIPLGLIGRFPLQQAQTENWPCLDDQGWWRLAVAMSRDSTELSSEIDRAVTKAGAEVGALVLAQWKHAPAL